MKPERDPFQTCAPFSAKLYRIPGKGGWVFVTVPPAVAPPVTSGWGMTPVIATVDGCEWPTTVWCDATKRSYLPVPKKIRGKKDDGDMVEVTLRMDRQRAFRQR